ncbi:hypothetical protein ScPMuIL_007837 [Solemya velum]
MPSYKLTYYNGRGLGELIRLTFVAAGVEYEDKRVNKTEWEELKPNVAVRTMPFLEVDGSIIGQSLTIARYVARQHGLMPMDNLQQALVEQIVDTVTDFRLEIFKAVFEFDEVRKVLLGTPLDFYAPAYPLYGYNSQPLRTDITGSSPSLGWSNNTSTTTSRWNFNTHFGSLTCPAEVSPTTQGEMMKKLNNETIPKYLDILEGILLSNLGGESFFIGESMTLADICVFDGFNIPLEKKLISLKEHPLLDSHYKRIEALPKISEWLEKRPKSEY